MKCQHTGCRPSQEDRTYPFQEGGGWHFRRADSTLVLLVCAETFKLHRKGSERHRRGDHAGLRNHRQDLQQRPDHHEAPGDGCPGNSIRDAVTQHFKDIGHDPGQHDVTYEKPQARERTQILMDVANKEGGLVVGTGDLSEVALGWSTYNGDHMSMYGVNGSVPKTLVRFVIKWVMDHRLSGPDEEKGFAWTTGCFVQDAAGYHGHPDLSRASSA